MNVLDFYWYLYYRFSFYICKREFGDAKWVATLGVALSFSLTVTILIESFLYVFSYSTFVKYRYSGAIIIVGVLMSVISIAYFYWIKRASIEKQEKQYIAFSPKRRKYAWILFCFVTIGSLVLELASILLIRPPLP